MTLATNTTCVWAARSTCIPECWQFVECCLECFLQLLCLCHLITSCLWHIKSTCCRCCCCGLVCDTQGGIPRHTETQQQSLSHRSTHSTADHATGWRVQESDSCELSETASCLCSRTIHTRDTTWQRTSSKTSKPHLCALVHRHQQHSLAAAWPAAAAPKPC